MCFFDILFTEIQVIFINFPIPHFLAKKSGKIYFIEHSQQHIDLSHRLMLQFARIHASSLINIEKILNRPITKFYNRDDVNLIAVELHLSKTRPTSFYKKHNLL